VLILENVPQIHSKKNIEHFDEWIKFLESKGYSNFWKDMNAKNFGIPQNRNRTFMVSILGDYTYEFPQEFPLKLRLKDMLEDSVDEKYYISDERIESIISSTFSQEKARIQTSDVCGTLLARDYKDPKCVQVGMLSGGKWDKLHDISRRVYSGEGVAPTIHTSGGGQQEPKIIEPRVIGGVGEKKSNGGTQWYQQDRIYDNECAMSVITGFLPYYKTEEPLAYDEQNGYVRQDGTVGTLTTDGSSPKHNNRVIEPRINVVGNYSPSGHDASRIVDTVGLAPTVKENHGTVRGIIEGVRIRKLIPLECWRLMGFDDADFEKAAQYNSNSQLYKQAGNSIVVDVLYYIFGMML
jgi:DNA (cytosine-5)-methyltransferase 1